MTKDSYGLPVRIRENGTIDYTDSAFLAGMLSLFGEEQRLDAYIKDFHLVRHPFGDENDQRVTKPENTSRDQLVAWASTKDKRIFVRETIHNYARQWFINKDFLTPLVRLYLYKQCRVRPPLWLYPLAYAWMVGDLLQHAVVPRFKRVEDQHEINQALCVYNALGLKRLFLAIHPSPDENMKDYYTRWRGQDHIYKMYLAWRDA